MAFFHDCHLLSQFGTIVNQRLYFAVYRIDILADTIQKLFFIGHIVCIDLI